ncbi:hypothetical protein JW921_01200 [Candidatus Fermentibacterales bacterium]|nr:hypothetical protein [Candidatus Fermentibacterales bacterium]
MGWPRRVERISGGANLIAYVAADLFLEGVGAGVALGALAGVELVPSVMASRWRSLRFPAMECLFLSGVGFLKAGLEGLEVTGQPGVVSLEAGALAVMGISLAVGFPVVRLAWRRLLGVTPRADLEAGLLRILVLFLVLHLACIGVLELTDGPVGAGWTAATGIAALGVSIAVVGRRGGRSRGAGEDGVIAEREPDGTVRLVVGSRIVGTCHMTDERVSDITGLSIESGTGTDAGGEALRALERLSRSLGARTLRLPMQGCPIPPETLLEEGFIGLESVWQKIVPMAGPARAGRKRRAAEG